MKIGIATFQWSDNYGAVLQANALQTFLKNQGHKVLIINFQPLKFNSGIRDLVARTPQAMIAKWEAAFKRKIFRDFRKKYLELTSEVFHSTDDLKQIESSFDLLISGSDQVWNPKWLIQFEGLWDLYFLRFAGKGTRCISYAASFGHADTDTMDKEWQRKISEGINAFAEISVREQSGIKIIAQLSGRNDAIQVADPTFLCDRPYYDLLAGPSRKHKPYLFSYMLHGLAKDALQLEKEISSQLRLEEFRCDAQKTFLHNGYLLPSPLGWLRMIRDATFVVTNSFHGVIFCLIFHIPFVVLLIDGELGAMNARIIELLNEIGLSSRIVSKSTYKFNSFGNESIDWIGVDREIKRMRNQAFSFLSSNIMLTR